MLKHLQEKNSGRAAMTTAHGAQAPPLPSVSSSRAFPGQGLPAETNPGAAAFGLVSASKILLHVT